jgi:pilus assembly protein CpaB
MLRRQTLIALGTAIVLGLVAVFLANSYFNATQQRQLAGGTTKVAVAAVPLSFGTDITADKVRFVEYPNSSIPPGTFTSAAQLLPAGKRRVALLPISINEPILASKISAEGQGASIAALLPAGMRAATVRINDVSGVAGFIQPNDSVDVLITRQLPTSDRATQVTDVLLQNVRVIAIDQTAKNNDGSPQVARTATLEVNPLDAQKLALAQEAGTLSLVLRKPGEQNNPVVETVSLNVLRYNKYGGARYPAPAVVGAYQAAPRPVVQVAVPRAPVRKKTASSRPSGTSVEIVRGVQGNQYKVGGYGK